MALHTNCLVVVHGDGVVVVGLGEFLQPSVDVMNASCMQISKFVIVGKMSNHISKLRGNLEIGLNCL